jgi:dTDP-4-dehydrorhamnose 3,5-epimerase
MRFIQTNIKGLYVIHPEPIEDKRGKFYRLYCQNELKEIGHHKNIVQINYSFTKKKGSIRGMHFQYLPKAEIKLVKCIAGSVFDVAIDLRKFSSTFLKWHSEIISAENMKTLYIPEGFAHGFQTLEDNCELLYIHTEVYSPEHEGSVRYDDPIIDIKWPLEITDISKRDSENKLLDDSFKGIEI